ncbi:hypothetical protein CK203_064271 [Vitis vinifera]|uniref:Uncharacterized protein n=1 Tax=Vitis vinifera TaxID=29760 RepID=A0A438GC53_VITVI|nr:hypothetical protein CK203_064271 [Vitis vinifera]
MTCLDDGANSNKPHHTRQRTRHAKERTRNRATGHHFFKSEQGKSSRRLTPINTPFHSPPVCFPRYFSISQILISLHNGKQLREAQEIHGGDRALRIR